MKTIFRFLSLAVVLAGLGASAAFAQDACADVDGQTALYTKVTDNYRKTTIPERQVAVDAGKQFLEKYGACEALKDQIDFVKPTTAAGEKWIADKTVGEKNKAMFGRFDAAVKGEKYDEVYAAGKEILAVQPENLNILIPLGTIGLVQSYNKNYKYNDDSIRYAQQALTLLKSGKELPKKDASGTPVAGAFQFECKREDCISSLTYAIGYINYYAKNDKKTALPYYYDVSQTAGMYKNEPRVYATIGAYYLESVGTLGKEIADLIAKQKAAKTDDEKVAVDAEIKPKIALFNGYAERALDAFGRAYTVAKSDTPANKTYRDGIYKQLQDIYKVRFDKTEGLDAWVSSAVAKPLPNPTSEVTPVTDPEPAKATGATATPDSAAPTAAAAAAASTVKSTPTATKAATPATVKPVAAAAPAASSTTPAKKTVATKKNP